MTEFLIISRYNSQLLSGVNPPTKNSSEPNIRRQNSEFKILVIPKCVLKCKTKSIDTDTFKTVIQQTADTIRSVFFRFNLNYGGCKLI